MVYTMYINDILLQYVFIFSCRFYFEFDKSLWFILNSSTESHKKNELFHKADLPSSFHTLLHI